MKRIYYILLIMCVALASCTEDMFNLSDTNVEFEEGENIRFTTNVPTLPGSTRAYSLNTDVLNGYKTIEEDYDVFVKMYEEGNDQSIGSALYEPVTTLAGNGKVYDEDGALTPAPDAIPLLWETNHKKYAFEATAGTEILQTDQSTREKWLAQDRLHGYAYAPLFDSEKAGENKSVDEIDALNYHTNKEWGTLNKAWLELDPSNVMHSTEHYKYIPLFLQHQRSWITLILKAGNGIRREALKFEDAQKNATVSFYSYKEGETEPLVIESSWAQATRINYGKDKNGEAEDNVETTCFNVIVEPHQYNGDNVLTDKIASINLSGLKFSFFAGNDENYTNSTLKTDENSSEEEKAKHDAAVAAMNAYNLAPGKHLTITATLTTDRIVFITAWIEDWTEVVTSTICDDYGQNGDPYLITSRPDLIEFLQDADKNKSGNVAIVVAPSLDLDVDIATTYYTKEEADAYNAAHKNDKDFVAKKEGDVKSINTNADPWSKYSNNTLNATLNLAGAKFYTSSQFLSSVASSGSIINGTFIMNNSTSVPSAIATTNAGTLERLSVSVGSSGQAKANRAGLVVTNQGTIYQCDSSLPVYGEAGTDYVGGIAAVSHAASTATMAVIDGCTVTASVRGEADVKGGGIVGNAEGRVTNNTFEYGITLLQPSDKFKNIVGEKIPEGSLRAQNNWWPTLTPNSFDTDDAANVNANTTALYHNVLDCQAELEELLKPQYNLQDYKYRISNSFTVYSDTWAHGMKHDDITQEGDFSKGNLICMLDGNNKTITLDGTAKVRIPKTVENGKVKEYGEEKNTSHMLFSNITGSIYDLIINIKTPLIATPELNGEVLSATDAIAPLAYSVTGQNASVRNVRVKMDDNAYIQAALPAGIVCWAYNGATVEGCEVDGPVMSWLPPGSATSDQSGDARRYAGGIVALAARATIKECVYHTATHTLQLAADSRATVYYGGILGGTTVKSTNSMTEYPAVSIIDCTSWLTPDKNATDYARRGTIIGYAQYTENNIQKNGTVTTGSDACQGNWWNNSYNGVASSISGMKTEDVIGKCNSYTPTNDITY